MEIGVAVGGTFLSSSLNILFDRLAPQGDLLTMFQKRKNDVRILTKLRMTLLGLQILLSDAENKQASNQFVSLWLNEIRDAVDSAENLIEEVNYEALRLKVESQHQNRAETTSNQQKGEEFVFNDVSERPPPSILRGFSAPIRLESDLTDNDLLFLLAHDSDEFNQWEAGQVLARKLMLSLVADFQQKKDLVLNPQFLQGIKSILTD